jgi:hypothetical protein
MSRARVAQAAAFIMVAGVMAPLVLLMVVSGRTTKRQIGRILRVTADKVVAEFEQWR